MDCEDFPGIKRKKIPVKIVPQNQPEYNGFCHNRAKNFEGDEKSEKQLSDSTLTCSGAMIHTETEQAIEPAIQPTIEPEIQPAIEPDNQVVDFIPTDPTADDTAADDTALLSSDPPTKLRARNNMEGYEEERVNAASGIGRLQTEFSMSEQ